MDIGVMNDWYIRLDGTLQIETHIFTDGGSVYTLKRNWKRL